MRIQINETQLTKAMPAWKVKNLSQTFGFGTLNLVCCLLFSRNMQKNPQDDDF